MAVYTVHEPPLRRDRSRAATRTASCSCATASISGRFVLGAAVDAVAPAVAGAAGLSSSSSASCRSGCWAARRVERGATFVVGLLIALLVGFEAATLRRWTLARRGWRNRRRGRRRRSRGRRAALLRCLGRRRDGAAAPSLAGTAAACRPPPARAAASPDVIGLFPRARRRSGERRHRRLRLRQPALGRQGVRARRARERPRRSRSW